MSKNGPRISREMERDASDTALEGGERGIPFVCVWEAKKVRKNKNLGGRGERGLVCQEGRKHRKKVPRGGEGGGGIQKEEGLITVESGEITGGRRHQVRDKNPERKKSTRKPSQKEKVSKGGKDTGRMAFIHW